MKKAVVEIKNWLEYEVELGERQLKEHVSFFVENPFDFFDGSSVCVDVACRLKVYKEILEIMDRESEKIEKDPSKLLEYLEYKVFNQASFIKRSTYELSNHMRANVNSVWVKTYKTIKECFERHSGKDS